MLMQLVENIEKDLQNTTKTKNSLNVICDISWNLLCPPGSGNRGKFICEKPVIGQETQCSSEGCSLLSNEVYREVSDLINYGKLIRSNGKVENIRGSDNVSKKSRNNEKKTLNKINNLDQVPLRSKCSTSRTGFKGSSSLDFKMSRSYSTSRDNCTERIEDNRSSNMQESTHSMMTPAVSYSHTCSSNLSGQIYSLKISEDLNNMLKLYNSYVNLKSNFIQEPKSEHQDNEHSFCTKFMKYVKRKLQNDLQSTNQYEEHKKYVDLVENRVKPQKHLVRVQYRSKEQLQLFEAKSHRLLKLQLQSKLLNIIVNFLSDSSDGAFE